MIIYKVANIINGKIYIGKTKRSLKERKREHLRDMQKCSYYFYNALKKYGEDNFTWEVIDTAETPEELNEKEKHWINHYKSYDDKFGYNSTLGGEISWAETHKFTDEDRDNLSLVNGGKWFLIYNLDGEFAGRYINVNRFCQENKITQSQFHNCLNHKRVSVKGLIPIYENEFTDELLKEKLSRVQIMKNNTPFLIYKVDDNSFVGEFNNQTEVSKIFNIPLPRINDCLSGRQKSTRGYYFKWK